MVQLFNLLGNKRLLILLLGLIFFIAVMGFTLGKRNQVTWPEQIVKDTVAWTQGMLYKPARNIAGFFDDVSRLTIIYEENEILKRTLMKYAIDTQRLNELEANNLRLQEALEFTENQSRVNAYRYRIAEVYAMSPDLYNNTITINLGARDGIKENMAVVSTKGLVGRVNWVSQLSSNVQLITDINDRSGSSKAIAATVLGKENESFGIIETYEKNVLLMYKIQPSDPIAVGDTIVTSGVGKVFPSGIVIGTVVARREGEFGLTHVAAIQPTASFRPGDLREVFVVEIQESR